MKTTESAKKLIELDARRTPGEWDNRCNDGLDNHALARHIWTEYGFIGQFYGPLGSSQIDAEFIAAAANTGADIARAYLALVQEIEDSLSEDDAMVAGKGDKEKA